MAGAKVKVEFQDADGGKYTISLQGPLSKDKMARIAEMAELLGGTPESTTAASQGSVIHDVYQMIEDKFPIQEFSSNQVLELYEDAARKSVPLSMISTYLSRLHNRELLARRKVGGSWIYRRTPR